MGGDGRGVSPLSSSLKHTSYFSSLDFWSTTMLSSSAWWSTISVFSRQPTPLISSLFLLISPDLSRSLSISLYLSSNLSVAFSGAFSSVLLCFSGSRMIALRPGTYRTRSDSSHWASRPAAVGLPERGRLVLAPCAPELVGHQFAPCLPPGKHTRPRLGSLPRRGPGIWVAQV